MPADKEQGMKPTYQELSYAVFQLATEDQHPDDIPQHVLGRLAELGMVHLEIGSSPQLTDQGKRAFTVMEDGDTVPDFEWSEGD
jgi:hypothetical protein